MRSLRITRNTIEVSINSDVKRSKILSHQKYCVPDRQRARMDIHWIGSFHQLSHPCLSNHQQTWLLTRRSTRTLYNDERRLSLPYTTRTMVSRIYVRAPINSNIMTTTVNVMRMTPLSTPTCVNRRKLEVWSHRNIHECCSSAQKGIRAGSDARDIRFASGVGNKNKVGAIHMQLTSRALCDTSKSGKYWKKTRTQLSGARKWKFWSQHYVY